jgi:hypothetical protein
VDAVTFRRGVAAESRALCQRIGYRETEHRVAGGYARVFMRKELC